MTTERTLTKLVPPKRRIARDIVKNPKVVDLLEDASKLMKELRSDGCRPITERQALTLVLLREWMEAAKETKLTARELFDLTDKRSVSGLMLRGVCRWSIKNGEWVFTVGIPREV